MVDLFTVIVKTSGYTVKVSVCEVYDGLQWCTVGVECVRKMCVSEKQFVSDCDVEIYCGEISDARMWASVIMVSSGMWHRFTSQETII
jgi:hypothetical protein